MDDLLQMTPYSGRLKRTPEPATAEPEDGPPNYRPADMGGESCGACQNFNQGQCAAYSTTVEQTMVCDDVTPAE